MSYIAFGVIPRVDTLRQMLGALVIIGALTILGYILNVRGGRPRLLRLCRLAVAGIAFGFAAGLVVSSYSDDLTGWLTRQHFVPLRFREFIVTHDPDIGYAPALGMVSGLCVAVCIWYRRHNYAAEQTGSS
jgi:hypothetical protein